MSPPKGFGRVKAQAKEPCLGSAIADQAASGIDIAHTRIGARSESYDDNGEPLCEPDAISSAEFNGSPWPAITHRPNIKDAHHIDTEN